MVCALIGTLSTGCTNPTNPPESESPGLVAQPENRPSPTPEVAPSQAPTPVATPTPVPETTYLTYEGEGDFFELPVTGATGYAPIQLNVRSEASTHSHLVITLPPGTAFRILEETGDWWRVDVQGTVGHVYHPYCMINLPDVLPSAVYKNTNASASALQASLTAIPNITGEQLYEAYGYNERLGREEFVMPVLYGAAIKIAQAQELALAEGNTLVICELYRPYEVQRSIVDNLAILANANSEVLAGITTSPWVMDWFIATSISNHQRGYAMDTSLGRVNKVELATSGVYQYERVVEVEEYTMQTPIHELSINSASLAYPVPSGSETAWRDAPVNEAMNEWSILLRRYCTEAGLTPLASEWWHFNDLDQKATAQSVGEYTISQCVSVAP